MTNHDAYLHARSTSVTILRRAAMAMAAALRVREAVAAGQYAEVACVPLVAMSDV